MNGIHDMGGMDGMGPIHPDATEGSPFTADWEAHAFAHLVATGALGRWNNDAVRRSLESFPAVDYLRMGYFERWHVALTNILVETGLLTRAEIESDQIGRKARDALRVLRATEVAAAMLKGDPYTRAVATRPLFAVGDKVRARNVHEAGHTRLPRYVRGRQGTIARNHGGHVFPDTNARFAGEQPHYLYSVRFEAAALWGSRSDPSSAVYVDIWEVHLDAAQS
jgi:nitrile hydratase beta subunit